jgi:hypothetical protein
MVCGCVIVSDQNNQNGRVAGATSQPCLRTHNHVEARLNTMLARGSQRAHLKTTAIIAPSLRPLGHVVTGLAMKRRPSVDFSGYWQECEMRGVNHH